MSTRYVQVPLDSSHERQTLACRPCLPQLSCLAKVACEQAVSCVQYGKDYIDPGEVEVRSWQLANGSIQHAAEPHVDIYAVVLPKNMVI